MTELKLQIQSKFEEQIKVMMNDVRKSQDDISQQRSYWENIISSHETEVNKIRRTMQEEKARFKEDKEFLKSKIQQLKDRLKQY